MTVAWAAFTKFGVNAYASAKSERLHPLDVSGLRSDEDVAGREEGRGLITVDEVPAIEIVFGLMV